MQDSPKLLADYGFEPTSLQEKALSEPSGGSTSLLKASLFEKG